MQRLTKEMVLARSKHLDLNLIKKFNCWGSDLCDVSIIKDMHLVEVLALSVNNISTLKPFENCLKLQELYVRKNNIQDLNEIAYLKHLPNLRKLWLEENPCCDRAGVSYRSIVLRALPNLKILDNIEVTQEEVDEALRSGSVLAEANIAKESQYEDAHTKQQKLQQKDQNNTMRKGNQQQTQQQNYEERQASLQQQQQQLCEHRRITSPKRERSPDLEYVTPRGGGDGNNSVRKFPEKAAITRSASTLSLKEFFQSDGSSYKLHNRLSLSNLSLWDKNQQQDYNNDKSYDGCSGFSEKPELGPRSEYRNARENIAHCLNESYRPKPSEGCYDDNLSSVTTVVLGRTYDQQEHNNYNPNDRRSAGAKRPEPVDLYAYRNRRENGTDWVEEKSPKIRSESYYDEPARSLSATVLFHSHQHQQQSNLNPYDKHSAVVGKQKPLDRASYRNRSEHSTDWVEQKSPQIRSESYYVEPARSLSATVLCHSHQHQQQSNLNPYDRYSAVVGKQKPLDRGSYRNGREYDTDLEDEMSRTRRLEQNYCDSARSVSMTELRHSRQQKQQNNLNAYGTEKPLPLDGCDYRNCIKNLVRDFHRPRRVRKSRILSAVLCLINELDYTSLEVLEHAVHCRLNDLAAE